MKYLLSVLFFFLFQISPFGIEAGETIYLTSGEWPPYYSKDLKHHGFGSRIIREAFKYQNIAVAYDFFPWARAYQMVKIGKWDGCVDREKIEEWKETFYSSDLLFEGQEVLFHLKSFNFDWRVIEDLKDITIGGTFSYSYGKEFQQALNKGKIAVDWASSDISNLKKLLKYRIQVFPMDRRVGYCLIKRMFSPQEAQQFTHHPKPTRIVKYHLILSKKRNRNRMLIELFNDGLHQLRISGRHFEYLLKNCDDLSIPSQTHRDGD